MTLRSLHQVIPSVAASDGAGVKLRRSLGSRPGFRLDPFLMLDEFYSDDPEDYLAGFPSHPHRGFETVTYMLDGHMRHEDNFGNRGDLGPGDVQWMTAAHGIVHSEMPQQTEGRMRGFQLWLNLPAKEKMKPAGYRDVPAREIPIVALPGGGELRVIAGRFGETGGPVNADHAHTTDPHYFDVRLPAGASIEVPMPPGHSAFAYAYEGEGTDLASGKSLPFRSVGIFGDGDSVSVRAGTEGLRFLLLAARPLHEPVVQYGPFVMNTHDEIEQAIRDYQEGRFATTA